MIFGGQGTVVGTCLDSEWKESTREFGGPHCCTFIALPQFKVLPNAKVTLNLKSRYQSLCPQAFRLQPHFLLYGVVSVTR